MEREIKYSDDLLRELNLAFIVASDKQLTATVETGEPPNGEDWDVFFGRQTALELERRGIYLTKNREVVNGS